MSTVEEVQLPKILINTLRQRAKKMGVSLEEYIIDILVQGFDPRESAEVYINSSKSLLEQAKEELKKGDIRQAAEKVWGAAALAVKAYAMYKEGRRLTSHGELWEYRRKVQEELGGWVYDSWTAAHSMHICFYEGWCGLEDVKEALERVGRLVEEVGKRLHPPRA